jgi:hypothetical protein
LASIPEDVCQKRKETLSKLKTDVESKLEDAQFEIGFCYANCVDVHSDQIAVNRTQYTD